MCPNTCTQLLFFKSEEVRIMLRLGTMDGSNTGLSPSRPVFLSCVKQKATQTCVGTSPHRWKLFGKSKEDYKNNQKYLKVIKVSITLMEKIKLVTLCVRFSTFWLVISNLLLYKSNLPNTGHCKLPHWNVSHKKHVGKHILPLSLAVKIMS